MSEPLTTEPTEVRAGDRSTWTRNLSAYPPADGWSLRYRILWTLPPHADITASTQGGLYLVDLTSAVTAAFRVGLAALVGWVERGAERVTLLQQPIRILADLTAATSLDGRSDNQKSLAAAKAALASFVAGGNAMVEEYEIAGRRMRFRSLKEVQDIVTHFEREVARDNAHAAMAQGVAPGRIFTRF